MSDWSPGKFLVIDFTDYDRMHNHLVLSQLLDFKLAFHCNFIEDHVFSQLAWIRKCQDVGVWSQSKCSLIALAVVYESSSTDAYILSLSQISVLDVVDGSMPDLSTAIDNSHF